jgi:diphthamide synthase (EF-2-diphthine--ammonia ligase)
VATGGALSRRAAVQVELGARVVLLTTFDAHTRTIAHQDTDVADAVAQARALAAPLLGVPLPRGGDIEGGGGGYIETVRGALARVREDAAASGGELAGLAFGDLHLAHVRAWRESARIQRRGEALLFPLWQRSQEDMLRELEAAGVPCVVSSVSDGAHGAIAVGERFGCALWQRARAAGIDGFGENGEFHTLARIWDAPSHAPGASR